VGLPVLGLDNVDRESPPWLADLLAAFSTHIDLRTPRFGGQPNKD
jgi:hypothetical protein